MFWHLLSVSFCVLPSFRFRSHSQFLLLFLKLQEIHLQSLLSFLEPQDSRNPRNPFAMAGRRTLLKTLTTRPQAKCAICTLERNSYLRNCVFAPQIDQNKTYDDLFILFTHQKSKKLISQIEDSRRDEFLDGKVYEVK